MKPLLVLFSMMLFLFSCEKEALKSTSSNANAPIEIRTEVPFKKVAMGVEYSNILFSDTIIKDSLAFQTFLSKIDTNLRSYYNIGNRIFEKEVDFDLYDVILASRTNPNLTSSFEIIKVEEKNGQIFVTTKLIMSDANSPSIPFYAVKIHKTNKKINFIHTTEE